MKNSILTVAMCAFASAACGSHGSASDPDGGGGSTTDSGTRTADGATFDGDSATTKFSFFVTSLAALRALSGNQNGFGGDLRYGETGQGAGLRGADKICAAIADRSMPGVGEAKTWHAFLSVAEDENGNQVNAIDRIGSGPWYDRLGRELAPSLDDLMGTRPTGGDTTIENDFPNEDGVPNHDPDGTGDEDNHDMLTGSTTTGTLYSTSANCLDWTANSGDKATEGQPRVGHSWPRNTGGGGGMGGGDMDSWMSSLTESGCAPGVNLAETGGPSQSADTVGDGGGYGGFYCFALTP